MIKEILLLSSFFLAGIIFMWIRNKLNNKVKATITNNTSTKEPFSMEKFKKAFNLADKVEWIKDFVSLFNARKLTIYCLVIGIIYAYGWYKGRLNAPIKVDLGFEKEWIMNIDGEEIYKPKDSNDVYIRDSETKEILKHIKHKDMGILREKVKPIAFQFKPIFIEGIGNGDKGIKHEVGAGLSYLRYWKWNLDAFLTNKGAYPIATSYKLTDSSSIGGGWGKGYKGDDRVIVYWRFTF